MREHHRTADFASCGSDFPGSSAASSPSDGLLTLSEAAHHLGLDKDHRAPEHAVRYLVRTRQVRYVKVGKTLRFRREWLDEYVDFRSVEPVRRLS
jgi:excisionase family DNA binding protein